jgi:hypothetical protein
MDEEPPLSFSGLIRTQLVCGGDHGMVDFIRKRLQVFVSSTYTDLIRQRQAAVEAILTAGHIPAGMELFTSGDESQMEVIKQWIDESDIFLLILGGRYGSLEPRTEKSYTQLEYEYAVEKGKPLFACVVTEVAQEKRVKEFGSGVLKTEHPQKLKEFRTLVLSRTSRFWDDFKDIKIAVGETLAQFARRDDLIGWVRPSQEANMPALADEIARLSKENAELRGQIARDRSEYSINGLRFDELRAILTGKGLLSILKENRLNLTPRFSVAQLHMDLEKLQELIALGLIEVTHTIGQDISDCKLTDAGRVFLNRLEAEKLLTQDIALGV